jgi:membrane-bound metal-dependent hydrolase YbcI (DUF457 family)
MLPIEHFIVALLPIAVVATLLERRLPTPRFVGVVFVGSQLPDLVDKPLAHYLFMLPSGRVGLHSFPIAILLFGVVAAYGWRTDRLRLSAAFIIAHTSHILADNYRPLFASPPSIPPDILWPFTDPTPRSAIPGWAGPNLINVRLWTLFSVVVLAVLGYVLIQDIRRELTD